jgi:hypothetical protein
MKEFFIKSDNFKDQINSLKVEISFESVIERLRKLKIIEEIF